MGKGKSKKRRHSSTSDSSTSGSSGSSSKSEMKKLLKLRKKLKKEKRKQEKIIKKRLRDEKKKLKKSRSREVPDEEQNSAADIPIELMERSKAMAPMTKEEWDKRQSVIRRVQDEETGRYRLIKGDGEILEEIVTHARHKEINRNASRADGEYFQSKTVLKKGI